MYQTYASCPCGKPHDIDDIELSLPGVAPAQPLIALDPSRLPPPRVRLYCCYNCASVYAEAEPGMPGRLNP